MLRILVLAGFVLFGYQWWKTHEVSGHGRSQAAEASPNGFQPVAMPSGAKENTVLVFAPLNCPHEDSQRANALAESLVRMGIPAVRSSSFSINVNNPTEEQNALLKRTAAIASSGIPVVFINGMGKSRPTLDEVVAEYARTK
jgi:hypothetical protein